MEDCVSFVTMFPFIKMQKEIIPLFLVNKLFKIKFKKSKYVDLPCGKIKSCLQKKYIHTAIKNKKMIYQVI